MFFVHVIAVRRHVRHSEFILWKIKGLEARNAFIILDLIL
jgi:hypothetical protein